MPKTQVKEEDLIRMLRTMQGGNTAPGQETPRPSVQDNLGTFQAMRAERPVQSPVDPGTHTQARRQADEQARQHAAALAEQRRQFDAQQAQQMALARMSMARSGGGGTTGGAPASKPQMATWIQGLAGEAAKQGRTISEVIRQLESPQFMGMWESGVMGLDEAKNLARRYYGSSLGGGDFASQHFSPFSYTPGEAARRQSAMSAADLAQGMNIVPPASGAHGATRADMLKFAQQDFHAGTPHTQIKPGTYQDPATGQYYKIDEWGNKIYDNHPDWGKRTLPSILAGGGG